MPAGRVLVVLVVALAVAALLNSEAIVRAGEGMGDGPDTRCRAVAGPARWTTRPARWALHLPREGFDLAFGQEPKTAVGHGARERVDRDPPSAQAARVAGFRQPTPERPLRVLVTGDSQAEFVGQRLVDVAPHGLLRTDVVARNGTGLTRPEFFNWEVNARQEIADAQAGRGGDAHGRQRRLQRGRGRQLVRPVHARSGRPSTRAAPRW